MATPTAKNGDALPSWLKDWTEIAKSPWTELLVGNGSSISVSPKFFYTSLYDIAATKSEPTLSPDARAIFQGLRLSDFEAVLSKIKTAIEVAEALGAPELRLQLAYDSIRDALVGAVAAIHPQPGDVQDGWLVSASSFLRSFKSVYTTNYDLLLYWAAMKDTNHFVDMFWSKKFNFAFDVANATISGATRTGIFYLHGALMPYENESRHVAKRVTTDVNPVLLPWILDRIGSGDVPVFISEGDSDDKLTAINSFAYLDFVLSSFRNSTANTVVYRHRLGLADNHIVKALKESGRKLFAVGLWPESADQLEADRSRITAGLSQTSSKLTRTIRFFDGRTLDMWSGAAPVRP